MKKIIEKIAMLFFNNKFICGQSAKGENASPKGIHHSIVPEQYLEQWKSNDLNKITTNIIYI